jgi:hypothetical protein
MTATRISRFLSPSWRWSCAESNGIGFAGAWDAAPASESKNAVAANVDMGSLPEEAASLPYDGINAVTPMA